MSAGLVPTIFLNFVSGDSSQTGQDGFPVTDVRNEPERDGLSILYAGNDCDGDGVSIHLFHNPLAQPEQYPRRIFPDSGVVRPGHRSFAAGSA